jgi:uncharacterized membrane protein
MKTKKITPEKFFLYSSLIVGVLLCFIVPIGAGYDEDTHEARIWEISKGVLVPNALLSTGPNFPSAFYELSYRQKYILEPVGLSFYQENLTKKIDWNNMIFHETRSNYFPALYLPQAFIMGLLGRVFDAPLIVILILCRLSNLLLYVFLGYLAIKTIPYGKWILCVLALAPMAITQASIISADPLTNSGSFLFIAYILHLSTLQTKLTNKDFFLLLGAIALLFAIKLNASALIILIFLLPRKLFRDKKQIFLLASCIGFLFIFLVIGWNLTAISPRGTVQEIEGVNALEQTKSILLDPSTYLSTLMTSFQMNGINFLKEWVGVMGYRYWSYPFILYLLFFILLILAFVKDATLRIKKRERIILLITFLLGIITTASALYITTNPVGSNSIEGINGRYFIPIMPLFFLAIIPNDKFKITIPENIMGFIYIVALFILMGSTILAYHVNCGTSYYLGGSCFLPVYKNWEPNQKFSEFINGETKYSQTFLAKCAPLSKVRLWVKPSNEEKNTYTRVVISDRSTKEVIAKKEFTNKNSGIAGWLEINFPSQKDSSGKIYEIYLSSEVTDEKGISLAISSRDEYKQGELSIDGALQEFDLLFQYGCN